MSEEKKNMEDLLQSELDLGDTEAVGAADDPFANIGANDDPFAGKWYRGYICGYRE